MTEDVRPIRVTGVGSWPGTDLAEALRITFEECPDLPYLPELPARGPYAELVGRATALLPGLAVDLQPAGWRLTDSPGQDQRRARRVFRDDLDQLEEVAQDYTGWFKVAVAGPWTLAASLERPRGDRAVADSGARRDLGQSLGEGVVDLVGELGRRLPGSQLIVQLDEPLLPAVLAGSLSTASGLGRHRAIDLPEVSQAYRELADRLAEVGEGVPLVVHSCAPGLPIELLHRAGVTGVAVDLDQLAAADWDAIGSRMEEGLWLGAGALPTGGGEPSADRVAERILRAVEMLGLDPATASQMVLTPACGLPGSTVREAVAALRTLRTAAGIVTERLAS